MAYQKLIIQGNLGSDIEVQYTPSGTAVAKLNVAVSERKKDGSDETQWFPVKMFGATAETVARFFSKGDTILLDGKMNFYSYEKDGVKKYGHEMVAFTFSFCGKPKQSTPSTQQQSQGSFQGNQGGSQGNQQKPMTGNFQNGSYVHQQDSGDIPF